MGWVRDTVAGWEAHRRTVDRDWCFISNVSFTHDYCINTLLQGYLFTTPLKGYDVIGRVRTVAGSIHFFWALLVGTLTHQCHSLFKDRKGSF